MDHIVCPSCGHKALPVATRCPGCGHDFETRLFQQPDSSSKSRWIPLGLLAAVAVAVVVMVGNQQQGPPVTTGGLPPRPAVPVVESVPPRPALAQPQPPPRAATSPTADSAPAPTPAPPRALAPIDAAEPVVLGPAERRYANTWVNVRADRNRNAAVVRTLKPGETVMVDSLIQGWYRAVAAGQLVGYVDRSFLDQTPR